ncbi:MAG: branched-chain amino acid ABC transporter permease [Pseudomonadota bacterium]
MTLELLTLSLLNGLSYGLLLFMLSAGLTLIFSMMGVLNFAHASFYMLGAYLAYAVSLVAGFWWALVLAPIVVGFAGAAFEYFCLRHVRRFGHAPELLVTFGLSFVVVELVQLVWGRSALNLSLPAALQGTLFNLYGVSFPTVRGFIMLVACAMLALLWWLLYRTRAGLLVQAALTHPDMLQALGHNVPRLFMAVFGAGAALAGLAGVLGGSAFVTDPSMAGSVGALLFVVVVVGGLGSLPGALLASLLVGLLQTLAVAIDRPVLGWLDTASPLGASLAAVKVSQLAPLLPFLLLVLVLITRPRGLLGKREG